ncbi:transmembrane and coiled-coil domain-containing protein 4-like isoform X2 [Anneissia japonica]|uniref:transmembrane and coiled-coil domain-containing protein 4-like isoform X2 n=1 Tax=Anneissia japonica TaxID=1529436 RepID=UPI00142557A0|nr:transmembrane and coiled-coil domain-containing protein 4-like isoform X2 [Anneissia japonica]
MESEKSEVEVNLMKPENVNQSGKEKNKELTSENDLYKNEISTGLKSEDSLKLNREDIGKKVAQLKEVSKLENQLDLKRIGTKNNEHEIMTVKNADPLDNQNEDTLVTLRKCTESTEISVNIPKKEDGPMPVEDAEILENLDSSKQTDVAKECNHGTIWHPLLASENEEAATEKEIKKEVVKKTDGNGSGGETIDIRRKELEENSKTPSPDGDVKDQEPEGAFSADTKDVEKKKKEKTPLVELAEKGMGISDILTETGVFAYISLVAIALATTFDSHWHKNWKDSYIKLLCKHLKTKRGIEKTMLQFLREDLKPLHAHAYVEVLKDDGMIQDNPSIIAQDLLGITMETGDYDARSRVIIYHIAKLMEVPRTDVISFEDMIVESFVQEEVIESEEQKSEKAKRSRQTKVKRYLAIGAATLGGGALIGLTGGLAAPLVASAGVALFGSGAAFLGTTAGLAIMASMFGAAGAGLGGYKMKRRVGAIEEFEFTSLGKEKDLHVVVAVSGWLTKDRLDNFTVPWLALAESKEQYTLKWESKYLKNLGDGLEYIMDSVMTMAAKEALKYTVLAGLLAAITLPAAAYGALSAIDNPWSIVTRRSVETGKELAEVLLTRLQGKRPVTLIGFSMGARVIFSALQELAVRKGSEGIVEDVVLLGAPITSSVKAWQPLERVVSGRIINGYCRGDWLLQFVYRTASVQVTNIAGLGPVNWDNKLVENIDLTDIVGGHLDYSEKIDEILKHIGLKTRPRSTSPLLRETGGAIETKEDSIKVDVCDLLLPQSQTVTEMMAGVPRSGSANSFLNDSDKKSGTGSEICKSASFPHITNYNAHSSESQRVRPSEGSSNVQNSETSEDVECGHDPMMQL